MLSVCLLDLEPNRAQQNFATVIASASLHHDGKEDCEIQLARTELNPEGSSRREGSKNLSPVATTMFHEMRWQLFILVIMENSDAEV